MTDFDGGGGCCCQCGDCKPAACETDEDGSFWTYCRKCNAWTEHAPAPEQETHDAE